MGRAGPQKDLALPTTRKEREALTDEQLLAFDDETLSQKIKEDALTLE